MADWLRSGRHSEHSLSVRGHDEGRNGSARPRPAAGHDTLFEVVVQHDYYSHPDNRCFDFEVVPNARTQRLMRSLGLLFRSDGAGFSVLHDFARDDSLARYLRTNKTIPAGAHEHETWTYLSFFLANRNPRFGNITDMPFDLRPLEKNFYLSNEAAHPTADAVILGQGASIGAQDLLQVKPRRFQVDVPAGCHVELRNAADTVLQTIQPGKDLGPPFYLDLTLQNEGWYKLVTLDGPGHDRAGSAPEAFIYTIVQPAPMCFLHILLTNPAETKKKNQGVYPVKLLSPLTAAEREKQPDRKDYEITSVTFLIQFAARSTRWVYYVVQRAPGPRLADLMIAGAGEEGAAPAPAFDGPIVVTLPTGARAYQFISTAPIPLQQRSMVNLKLTLRTSRPGAAAEETVLVERLPVASADQVRPETQCPPASGWNPSDTFSDIYVYV